MLTFQKSKTIGELKFKNIASSINIVIMVSRVAGKTENPANLGNLRLP